MSETNLEIVEKALTAKGQQIQTIASKCDLTHESVVAACKQLRSDGKAVYCSDSSGYKLPTFKRVAEALASPWGNNKQQRTFKTYY